MGRNTMGERGQINFVKIFIIAGVALVGYFAWVYLPLYIDDYNVKKAVRTACNVAYGSRNVEAIKSTVLTGWKEAEMLNTELAPDGTLLTKPAELEESRLVINLTQQPAEVSIEISYDRSFVMPFSKKVRTKTFKYSHSEDLAPIKY